MKKIVRSAVRVVVVDECARGLDDITRWAGKFVVDSSEEEEEVSKLEGGTEDGTLQVITHHLYVENGLALFSCNKQITLQSYIMEGEYQNPNGVVRPSFISFFSPPNCRTGSKTQRVSFAEP